MSPNCSFLEFLAYILEKSSKFGIFSSQNETEIMFFWGPIGIFGLISSVWDVFNRIQSYLEPGNLKSSFFGNFKFEANFAHFLASKNDYSHKSAIFSWKKPKWSKKDENMYKLYRKYKKNGFQNTLKMAKMCSLRGTVPRPIRQHHPRSDPNAAVDSPTPVRKMMVVLIQLLSIIRIFRYCGGFIGFCNVSRFIIQSCM